MRKGSVILVLLFNLLCLQCRGGSGNAPAQGESAPVPAQPEKKNLILATTTSTQDSGLLDALVPMFEKKTGFLVKTIAVGSGQAMAMGRRGDADVLLVHSPAAEEAFMKDGFGRNRTLVMHNDFVIVGPAEDPAKLKGGKDAAAALKALDDAGALFVSRADDSGTHAMEKDLWKKTGLDPAGRTWYMETGSGMGQTLYVASEKSGYTLADRGTYLALKKNLHLEILVEGDPMLHNVYHVIEVNPDRFPEANGAGARAFSDFLVSDDAQALMETFGKEKFGQPLFFPDAGTADRAAP